MLQTEQTLINNFLIQDYITLHDKNWFGTGGKARYYAEPKNAFECQQAIQFAQRLNIDFSLLGQGANVLISDDGFDGLIIRPKMNEINIVERDSEHIFVQAGSGVTIDQLIEWCLDHNILGLEEFSAIPGTVGGAVYINLHYFQFLLAQFITSAQLLEYSTGKIFTVDKDWFEFGYDHSKLHEKNHLLMCATFKLKSATDLETAFARGRRTEIIRHRHQRYPYKNTCGSFFRNFHDHEVTLEVNGKKAIWAAYYLDKIGIKGTLTIGDAVVSHQHANMIVNKGNATSADIVNLARTMQEMVRDRFGITPQPECQLIGFKEYPLL